jgi:outer membrane protein assembly factor BamD (BamD/ComL family)
MFAAVAIWLVPAAGCALELPFKNPLAKTPELGAGPVDSLVLRGGDLERDRPQIDPELQTKLEGAHALRLKEQYSKAGNAYHYIATIKKIPLPVLEESLFWEAETYYLSGNYRAAEPLFKKLLGTEFRYGRFQDQAAKRLFEIADYWLEPTRAQIKAWEEKRQGQRWLVMPASYFHIAQDKPWLDMEGRAIRALEEVRLHDLNGPLGERALMMMATVKAFREDYREADYYFSELYKHYPNSPLAPEAIKRSIICKQMMTGGSVYDTRVLQEAQQLIQTAGSYPELANNDFLRRQLISISTQQADRDFNIAELYRRTGHPGAAYFYYELVCRQHPGSKYAERAEQRKSEMAARLDRRGESSSLLPIPSIVAPRPLPQSLTTGDEPRPGLDPGQGDAFSPPAR